MRKAILTFCFIMASQCDSAAGSDPYVTPSAPSAPSAPSIPRCEEGLISETPCSQMLCIDGQIVISDTFCPSRPVCVDSIDVPGKCCPVCPNGPNCEYTDGSIVPNGGPRYMSDGKLCACEPAGGYYDGYHIKCYEEPQ